MHGGLLCRSLDLLRSLGMTRAVIPSAVEGSAPAVSCTWYRVQVVPPRRDASVH
jgi:hypothetical protein